MDSSSRPRSRSQLSEKRTGALCQPDAVDRSAFRSRPRRPRGRPRYSRGHLAINPGEEDGSDHRDDDGVDEAALGPEAHEAHEKSSHQRSQEADDDVHEGALARAALDPPGQPSRDEPDDDPPDDAHGCLRAAELLDMRTASAPA